jgi:hypothetical protein
VLIPSPPKNPHLSVTGTLAHIPEPHILFSLYLVRGKDAEIKISERTTHWIGTKPTIKLAKRVKECFSNAQSFEISSGFLR